MCTVGRGRAETGVCTVGRGRAGTGVYGEGTS